MTLRKVVFALILISVCSINGYWENVTPIDSAIAFQYAYCYGDSSVMAIPAKYNPLNLFFVSHNNGKQWDTLCKTNIPTYQRFNNIIDFKGILFASLYGSSDYGILKSADTGKTWESIVFPGGDSYCITSTNNHLIASSGSYIFISADTGKSWTDIKSEAGSPGTVLALNTYEDTIFATGYVNFIVSKDFGESWSENPPGYISGFSLERRGKNFLAGSRGGVYLSRDICKTWDYLLGGAGAGFWVGDSTIFLSMLNGETHISYDWGKTINEFQYTPDQIGAIKFTNNDYYIFVSAIEGFFRFPIFDDVTDTKLIHYHPILT